MGGIQLRLITRPIADQIQAKSLARRMAYEVDRAALQRGVSDPEYALKACNAANRDLRELYWERRRSPDLDVSFSLWLFVLPGGRVLGIADCEQETMLTRFFEDFPGVTKYAYWNNIDPDETVSEEDWEKRAEDWNDALDRRNNTPQWRVDLIPEQSTVRMGALAEVWKHIPGLDARARRQARDRLINRMFNARFDGASSTEVRLSQVANQMMIAGSESAAPAVDALVARFKRRLLPSLLPVLPAHWARLKA